MRSEPNPLAPPPSSYAPGDIVPVYLDPQTGRRVAGQAQLLRSRPHRGAGELWEVRWVTVEGIPAAPDLPSSWEVIV